LLDKSKIKQVYGIEAIDYKISLRLMLKRLLMDK
jgi:hypothetical protein